MRRAASNPPLFLEAFSDGWTELIEQNPMQTPPVVDHVNDILGAHRIGYRLNPPALELLGEAAPLVQVAVPALTMEDRAREVISGSLDRAAEHLQRGDDRAAVMESLWLLDSVATVFTGLTLPTGQVNGVYFNTIVGELRRLQAGGALPHVIRWMETMYGYLSAPGRWSDSARNEFERGSSAKSKRSTALLQSDTKLYRVFARRARAHHAGADRRFRMMETLVLIGVAVRRSGRRIC
jgi:hypothetical protein